MATQVTVESTLEDRLGHDLKFPITNNFEPVKGLNLLLQDIQQLLLTIPGERVNRPEYGCTLRNQIWENFEAVVEDGPSSIKTALLNYEPRIDVIDVVANPNRNTGYIQFTIKFIVKNTDTKVNLIFPFRSGQALSFA